MIDWSMLADARAYLNGHVPVLFQWPDTMLRPGGSWVTRWLDTDKITLKR